MKVPTNPRVSADVDLTSRAPGPTNPKTAPKLNLMDAKSLLSKPSKRIGKIG